MTVIKVQIKDIIVPVFMFRSNINKSNYTKLMKALIDRLTEDQINNIIVRVNERPYILFDSLKNCFEFKGKVKGESSHCICGHAIKYNYSIVNKETIQNHIIGSTCVDQWSSLDASCYTDSKRKRLLKSIFNILAEDYRKLPRFTFGKCKGKTFNSVAKKDRSYCSWLLRGNFSDTVRKNVLNAIDSLNN
jgi:hypothetical protein